MTTIAGLSAVASSGNALSMPQSAGMQSSLPLLKKNYKFSKVFFWGKLNGMKGDYLIAKGIEESYDTKKFFYCQDGVSWAQLPSVTDEMSALVAKVSTHGLQLSGDISTSIEVAADPLPEGEEPPEPPEPQFVIEISRVAVIVETIDAECAMAPLAALTKKADHSIVDSPTFSGLSYEKAKSAASYVFINQPKAPSVLADALAASTDFLTSCSDIVPAGALTCKFDEPNSCMTWRSLVYPGFVAYASVGSPLHGYAYFGTGLKNGDIAFMLP